MNYLIPFSVLKNSTRLLSVRGQLKVDLNYDEFLEIVKKLLLAVPVDETWYLAKYDDVADAIRAGTYRNAKQHFIENGYFEGRRPFESQVDAAWYLEEYPDVKTGIAEGTIMSAADHFASHGYDEGRLPIRP
jgi:hypothetical protein